ncbi:tRNA lysidine(34) synthetase TilS [Thauera aromatica]|uniref:tRNA(Ile)-lysidine synthase n=2 Tax=Thauera aromatica TaxID=59405 RepID=A0A2R4BKT7_THAAR|nr:tRNA lysidine(34) synthetase TilS [Thauera aromatica]AVR87921.1 tRNA(Ile)-lysidine synthetase [Thauera aromatica K172]MCK2094938.1 tRNA lysidine(34) synthetase TilS [Thauera aromatica]
MGMVVHDELRSEVGRVLAAAGVGPHSRLCCALSGGVDSVSLFTLLCSLQAPFGYALSAAHVHHGLSPNADAWAAACARRCERAGVPFQLFRVTVARDHPGGLEAAAREARRAALDRVECDWLVLGHHQDDQAETVLFRLLRGAGVHGAAAMAALDRPRSARCPGRLRPLLGVRRAQILAWARAAGLRWEEDESNADERYTRNALRRQLLPAAERIFPAAVPALARAAENFREADTLLDELAALDAAACGGAPLSRSAALALGAARLGNLLRWQLRGAGALAPSRARLVEAVRQLCAAGADTPLRLVLGDRACCAYRDALWLEAAAPAPLPPAQRWHGQAALPWGQGEVVFAGAEGEGLSRVRLAAAAEVSLAPRREGMKLRLDSRRPRRSFKNLCQEAAIPAWLRARLPVLWVDGEPAWVAGIGVAAEFACAAGETGVVPRWHAAAAGADPARGVS